MKRIFAEEKIRRSAVKFNGVNTHRVRAEFIDQDGIGVINDFTHDAPRKNITVEVKKTQNWSSHQKIMMTETKKPVSI